MLGPGLITGASDGDPSGFLSCIMAASSDRESEPGIGTYAVTGASLGFSTLWTALFALFCDAGISLTVEGTLSALRV